MPDRANGAPLPHALDDRRVQLVLQFVDENLRRPVSVRDLAAVVSLSPFHFSRAFRRATGQSPHRFLRQRRLEKAKELLLEGKVTLAEVALICNFSSQASFTRAFTRVTGIPPGQYRRDQAVDQKEESHSPRNEQEQQER